MRVALRRRQQNNKGFILVADAQAALLSSTFVDTIFRTAAQSSEHLSAMLSAEWGGGVFRSIKTDVCVKNEQEHQKLQRTAMQPFSAKRQFQVRDVNPCHKRSQSLIRPCEANGLLHTCTCKPYHRSACSTNNDPCLKLSVRGIGQTDQLKNKPCNLPDAVMGV